MNTRVHVLNATYEDFDVVPAARAVVLVAEELAVTLVEHTPRFVVRSQHVAIPLPLTIQLLEYVHTPPRPVVDDDSRATFPAILARDHYRCAYCGRAGVRTVDHVFPAAVAVVTPSATSSPPARTATAARPTALLKRPACRCCGSRGHPETTSSASAGSGATRPRQSETP